MSMIIKSWDELPLTLTAEEAATAARVNIKRIYELAKTKGTGFPVFFSGKAIRIPRDAFRRWLDSQAS